jgi:DNA-binding NtrC family response regulator
MTQASLAPDAPGANHAAEWAEREEIPVDVRVICATHRDLAREVKKGRFREDLYFRLVVYPIRVPALRERKADIPLLVAHFLRKYQGRRQKAR